MHVLRSGSVRLTFTLAWGLSALAYAGCSGDSNDGVGATNNGDDSGTGSDGAGSGDGGTVGNDGGTSNAEGGIPFTCAETAAHVAPNDCPAISGSHGQASFCFRPQWSGVTSVEVYLSANNQSSDWSAPFLTLANDGSGTFTGSTALTDGTYPYIYRVHGSADGLVKDGQYLLDQENPAFQPSPTGAPLQRSISQITVPQVATPIYHVRGKIVYAGAPQPCYSVDLEAGELLKPGGGVLSEHTTANFVESASDGTFDFPVGAGQIGITVRFPFKLASADGGYPDPFSMPSVGTIRGNVIVTDQDLQLDPADIQYPEADYAKMDPVDGSATLPVTFTYSLTPGSGAAQASVTSTNIAGNDPAWASGFSGATSQTWDGGFNGSSGGVTLGTTYYWGAWQRFNPAEDGGIQWTSQSLLFPIAFH